MSEVKICLGIPHTPWVPERVKSMTDLALALGLSTAPAEVRLFTERAPNHQWSGSMWKWGAESGATHFLTLQDDAIVAPNFWAAARAIIEAIPDEVICFEVVHPATRTLAKEGHKFFTTSDALVGVGYALPTKLLRDFVQWRATMLKSGAIEAINEDTLLATWCMVTGHRIWHPIPTIIDHDVSLKSSYGNDQHSARRPLVRWDAKIDTPDGGFGDKSLENSAWWLSGEDVIDPPHLGRFPGWHIPSLALRWVVGVTPKDVARWMADDGRKVLRALEYRRRIAEGDTEAKHRIYIATPHLGEVHPEHTRSIVTLCATTSGVEFEFPTIVETYAQTVRDVVRARSRLVRQFLETDATHLLFLDADISFDVIAIAGMLATGKDLVLCPYPRRQGIYFEHVAKEDGRPAESRAYAFALRAMDGHDGTIEADGTTEIAGFGLGCALIARQCLEKMVAHFGKDLTFHDLFTGQPMPTVALFQLLLVGVELLSEDHSFCARWREIGGKVWMYLGPGSPVTHHGDHAFRGMIESFGLKHEHLP